MPLAAAKSMPLKSRWGHARRLVFPIWLAEAQAGESSTFTCFLFTCMEWAVKLSRLVLRLLMHLGRAASCFLSRQMEFDADHYQIQVAGSGAFESASQRITLLHCLL